MGDYSDQERIPVWLDCDPGHDDALAIILAGYSRRCDLIGISTVAGNQSIDKVTDNALRVLSAAGLDHVPVYMGQGKPLMRPPLHCPEIHGESGLDGPLGGPVLPPADRGPSPGKAVLEMHAAIKARFEADGGRARVRLVATGALSNVALLFILFPEAAGVVDVVLMGGALGVGNTGAVVEFNMQIDPEAARVVFDSGARVTMVPLEVTHTALVTPEVLDRIRSPLDHPFLELIAELLLFFADTYRRVFRFEHPPLHDPCAVAYVVAPELFEVEHLRVDIETASTLSAGQTVVDVWGSSGRAPNAHVAMAMDVSRFWDAMVGAIHAAAAASPLRERAAVLRARNGYASGSSMASLSTAAAAVNGGDSSAGEDGEKAAAP